MKAVHDKSKPFSCNVCDRAFSERYKMKNHINIVHKGEKIFKCAICEISFSGKGNLNVHVSSVHQMKKPFKCDVCSKCYTTNNSLIKHIASIHENQKYDCEMCDKIFTGTSCLNRHIRSVHQVIWSHSNVIFVIELSHITQNWNIHIISVHDKQKPFKCNICNRAFRYNEAAHTRQFMWDKNH